MPSWHGGTFIVRKLGYSNISIHWLKVAVFNCYDIFPMPHQIRNGVRAVACRYIHCEEIRIFSNIFTPKKAELLSHFPILPPKWRFSNCYDLVPIPFRSETGVINHVMAFKDIHCEETVLLEYFQVAAILLNSACHYYYYYYLFDHSYKKHKYNTAWQETST